MAACDVNCMTLTRPTTTQTINEGDSFTAGAGGSQTQPPFPQICANGTISTEIDFRKLGDVPWTIIDTTTALKTNSANPTAMNGTSPCTTEQVTWAVVANTGSGGVTYEISVLGTSDDTLNTLRTGSVQIIVNAAGGKLPILGVGP